MTKIKRKVGNGQGRKEKRFELRRGERGSVTNVIGHGGHATYVALGTPSGTFLDPVIETAIRVSGSRRVGEQWYNTPNSMLGGRTPKQAAAEGDASLAVGLLLNVAGA